MTFLSVLFRIGFFFIAISSNTVKLSFVVPRSSVVLIGDRVEMNCSMRDRPNDSVTWTHTSPNSSTETPIYLGKDIFSSMRSRYKIDANISGQHNLIIDSADLAHAGIYRCISIISESPINDVYLTVIGLYPICGANTTDGPKHANLSIWCSISYMGSAIPAFRCIHGNDANYITADTTSFDTSKMLLTKAFLVKQQLNANDSEVVFQCRITFELSNNYYSPEDSYSYTWNYTLYGPVNISIVRFGDRLECSADGNPTPKYRWTHMEGNKSTNGFSLFIPNDTVAFEKNHTFQCTAANILAAKHATIIIQGSSTAKDSGGTQGDRTIALITGGFILFLLIAAILGSWVVHRKRLNDNADARPDVALNTDLNSYEDITLISINSSNQILDGELPESSDGRMIADNSVYSEVWEPNGRSNGSNGGTGNLGDISRTFQIPTRGRKNLIGADGTEYADLSEVSPSAHKVQSAQKPAFNRVDVYASIDHIARAPPAPPKL